MKSITNKYVQSLTVAVMLVAVVFSVFSISTTVQAAGSTAGSTSYSYSGGSGSSGGSSYSGGSGNGGGSAAVSTSYTYDSASNSNDGGNYDSGCCSNTSSGSTAVTTTYTYPSSGCDSNCGGSGCSYDCGGESCTYNCGGGCTYDCGGCTHNCGSTPAPSCDDLYLSPSSVEYGGDTTIHWSTTNASTAYLTGFGYVSLDGSKNIYNVTSDKEYTLTVDGYGKTTTCHASLHVEEEEQDLECKLKVSDSHVNRGDKVKLTWSSDGAEYGRISPEVGNVDENGSEYVYPDSDTTYKGTFYNDDGDKVTCSVKVNVDDEPVYHTSTPYITLAAVPYTGLDLGPVGTFLYWSFLILWCLFAAYLIVVKRAHMSIYRWYKKALFGENVPAPVEQTPVFAGFSQTDLASFAAMLRSALEGTTVSHTSEQAAPEAHSDGVDPFILSQINRGKRS